MRKVWEKLLQYKFTILTTFLALLAFFTLYVYEQYKQTATLPPGMLSIIQSVALAFLTSGVVSFIFEYFTRKEFSELMQVIVHEEVVNLQRGEGTTPQNEALRSFWKPFIEDGAVIVVAEDTQIANEPTIRSSDLETALRLYQGLLSRYVLPRDSAKLKIDFIPKHRPVLTFPFKQNMIVVAAPGANPLATTILHTLKGLPIHAPVVKNGYIFSVHASDPPKYLQNPYIRISEDGFVGILELQNGNVIHRYERYIPSHPDASSHDCCLVVKGVITPPDSMPIHVLLIAGHSRYATNDAVEYLLTSLEWAELTRRLTSPNIEAVLLMSGTLSLKRQVSLAQPPRPIRTEKKS
jgi:hypothetical protein